MLQGPSRTTEGRGARPIGVRRIPGEQAVQKARKERIPGTKPVDNLHITIAVGVGMRSAGSMSLSFEQMTT